MEARTARLEGDILVIHIPMRFKRRGGRKEIVVPPGLQAAEPPGKRAHGPLAVAVARAHRWLDLLDEGRFESVSALARHIGVDHSYVRRLLDLALLAPDIVAAILRGDEPSGLSLARLRAGVPIPWEDQRRKFGFPPVEYA